MILAGDIGGTKTNLAYFDLRDGRLVPEQVKSYPSREHSSLREIVRKFTGEFPSNVTASAFGVAGPVINARSETTNLSWIVDAGELADLLGLNVVGLINDLEATAYGILRLKESDILVLNKGVRNKGGAIAVIAAGTGLGEAGLVWDGTRYIALPSEGGHTDFAPRSDLEIELLKFLLQRYQRVSYERIVSGPGLYNLYQFFRSRSDSAEPQWLAGRIKNGDPSAEVSKAALEKTDDVSVETLDTFVSLYGAEAGNLALKLLATGGLYVGGGIAPKICELLQHGPFMKSFTQKGRYTGLLSNVPVSVVMNEKTALFGAAHFAAMMQG